MKLLSNSAALGLTATLCSLSLFLSPSTNAGTWQAGILAENSRSPFIDDRRNTEFLPMLNYLGEKFSYVNGQAQYKFWSGESSEILAAARIRPSQYYAASLGVSDDLSLEGMGDRDSAFEMGIAWQLQSYWGKFVAESFLDVSGKHKGFEITAKYSYPKQFGKWLIEPAIGVQWQSDDLIDYYHGVLDSETSVDRPAYQGEQSLNPMIGLTVGYSISPKILALAGMEYLYLDDGISASPIVARDEVQKFYFGVLYSF